MVCFYFSFLVTPAPRAGWAPAGIRIKRLRVRIPTGVRPGVGPPARFGLSGLLLCGLVFVGATSARAQFATVRGQVVDEADGQPLPGTSIVLRSEEGDQIGTAADGNGYFVLPRVPPGRYALAATFVGYVPYADTLVLDFGDQAAFVVELAANETALGEVAVEADVGAERTTGGAGFQTVTPAELARVPAPGLSADLAAYLRTQPGFVSTGDQGGQLFVQGGTPTQNLVLLDGMPVYHPFHLIGSYSAFPAGLVSYADVYAGGFPARYGGRLSSAIDVATRNGNKRRVEGAASITPLLGSVQLEGPLVPEKVSVLASVRASMIERVAPGLLGRALPYRFGDRFVKLHAFLTRLSSLALTAMSTSDRGNLTGTAGAEGQIGWHSGAYGGRFVYLPEDFAALFSVRFFGSRLRSRYRPAEQLERIAEVDEFGGEMGLTYFLGRAEAQVTLFGRTGRFAYGLADPLQQAEEFLTEGGFFLDLAADLPAGLRVEPGLRFHSFPSRYQAVFEPRLRVAWQPGGTSGRHSFSAAWGVYHQEIVGRYNLRDVADVFVTWAPSPPNRPVPRATHLIAGWDGRLGRGLTVSVEGYRKRLANLTLLDSGTEGGAARGADVRLAWGRRGFYVALGYGLAGVWYGTEDQPYRPPHDRRHRTDVQARLTRGAYAFGARWQFGSGLPFTQIRGAYEHVPVADDDLGYRTAAGALVPVYAEPFGARLPAYHRLDVAAERRFAFERFAVTAQAAVVNAYDRANLFAYDPLRDRRVNQLPLIPSLGLRVEVF